MIQRRVAAIPYRFSSEGHIEVLLVTSKKRGRWVFPKGKAHRLGLPHSCAAREAFEEAGVTGEIERFPTAKYRQVKAKEDGGSTEIVIDAFLLRVDAELRAWPEKVTRQRRWMSIAAAMNAVQDVELRSVLGSFASRLNAQA